MSNASVIAAQILLQRRNARRSLADWARINGFEPATHHSLLIDKLEAVVRGECRRLMVFMPPGSAKSTYSSVLFPPWYLAQRPDSAILTASHSADLATSFGRRARNLIASQNTVLQYTLCKDSQAADEWGTSNGGHYFCAGVGGRIAGRRADLGLIDDPVGSKEDAYSKVVRDSTWDWYRFDFRTRLKPGAAVVLIQTRWHEDDLAGRLLTSEGKEWQVVNLPLLAEENDALGRQPGELLWKEYFTEGQVADLKKDRALFAALGQQRPSPEDGDFFHKDWITLGLYDRNELPESLSVYVASDHAVSLRERADFSCFIPVGVDANGVVWILPDVFWEKCDSANAVSAMIGLMRRRHPFVWWAESEKITKSIGPFLRKRMREEGVFCYIEEIHPSRDKTTRARSIQGRMQAGMIRFPRWVPWLDRAVDQMLKFPNGLHDDFVDPLAYIGLGLDKMMVGQKPVVDVDVSEYFKPKPMTLRWLKESDRRRGVYRELALRDN